MEAKYRQFLEDINDGCAVLVEGVIVFANRRFADIFGYDPNRINGMPVIQFIQSEESQTLIERYERVMNGEEEVPECLEVVAKKQDGTNIIVEVSAKVIRYDNKPAICVIARDITKRKLAEDELSIFYNAVEGAADAIIITDIDGIILYANRTTEETFGYKNDEILGKPAASFNSCSETTRDMISAMKKTGQWRGEVEQVKKNKETFTALISLSQIRGAEGTPIAIMGTIRDITDRKRMEEELIATRKYAQSLIENSLNMIISVDTERRIVEFNSAAQEAFGYTKEEILGQHIDILYVNPDNAAKAGDEARRTGRYTGEVVNKRKNGETFISYLAASVLTNENDDFVGVMGVSSDITERKQIEEKYQCLLEEMTDGYAVLQDGIFVFANKRLEEIFGYEPGQVIGKTYEQFMLPDDRYAAKQQYKRVISGKEVAPERHEAMALKVDGTPIVIETSRSALLYEGRPAFGIILRDITDRKYAEEKYRQLLDDMNDGYAVIQDWKYVFINRRYGEILKIDETQLLGASIVDLMPPENRQTYMEEYEYLLNGKGSVSPRIESTWKKSDGRNIIAETTHKSIQYEGKPAIGIIARDITERKQAEEKYRQLVEEMNDGYLVVNQEGNIVFANERFSQMFGYESWQVQGKPLSHFAAPDTRMDIAQLYQKVMNEQYSPEQRISLAIKRDGSFITTESSINFILYEDKPAICVIVRDVTDRNRMQEEIQLNYETQAMLNTLLKVSLEDIPLEEILNRSLSIVLSVFHSDLEGNGSIFLVEDEPEVLIRKAQFAYDDSFPGTCTRVPFGKCLCGQAAQTGEVQFADHIDNYHDINNEALGPHGHYVIPLLSAKKVLGVMTIYTVEGHARNNREEEILGSVANVLSGIIERKQAEIILRESEEKLSLIFESVPEGIIISDLKGNIIDINAGAIYMHGYDTKDEIIGHSIFNLVSDREHAKGIENMKKTLQTGSMGLIYHTSVKKDNSSFPSAMNAVVLKGAGGQPAGFIIIVVDATEPQKMQDRLIMADRLASLGEMISGIAHELNNPLGAILGLSQLLQGKDLTTDVKEDVALINRETGRAVSIVKNLLSFARKKEMVRQPVLINSIIESVLEIRVYEQKVNNIKVITNLATNLPLVRADTPQLQQVFLNIVINAEYFMTKAHNKGTLTITTEKKGDFVRASFADNGPGIATKDLKIIFNPFFTTKEVGKGTGLGLSISHGIVSEHGGQIYVRSEAGKGATFIVELPVETTVD